MECMGKSPRGPGSVLFNRRMGAVLLATLACLASVVLTRYVLHFNEFANCPAFIAEIRPDGTFVLETHHGQRVGPLAGVDWERARAMPSFDGELQKAQGDVVDWAEGKDGLRIWYPSSQGDRVSLNQQLGAMTPGLVARVLPTLVIYGIGAMLITAVVFSLAGFTCIGCPPLARAMTRSWAAYVSWRDHRIPPHCCRTCRYDLSGNTSGICPECGTRSRR